MKNLQLIRQLKVYKEQSSERYGIKRLGVFGSCAVGGETEKSDIDIVVELDTPDIFKLVHIKEELEGLLGKPVDIVRSRPRMNPYLRKHIESRAIYV